MKAKAKKSKFIVRKSKKTGKQIKLYGAPMAKVLASEKIKKRRNGAKRAAAARRRNSTAVPSRRKPVARNSRIVPRKRANISRKRRSVPRKNARRMTSRKPFDAIVAATPAAQFSNLVGLTNPRRKKRKRNPLGAMLLGVNGRGAARRGTKRRRRNGEGGLFEEFHGRPADGYKVGLAPIGTPKDTEFLGKLECIEYRNGSKSEMSFGHGDHDQPDLVANRTGKHLYFVGDIPCWPDKAGQFHGYATKIEYHAIKDHIDGGTKTLYFHKVGEETGVLPELYTDAEGYLVLKGGEYYVTADGIIN